jgi:hypothetical protein
MNNAKNSNVSIKLDDFNFDPKAMQLIHHQFSGKRSAFIKHLDDLLGCWGMAGAANPNLNFGYHLTAKLEDGETQERTQVFHAQHVIVNVDAIISPIEFDDGGLTQLENPKDLVKLYDLGFTAARATAPSYTVASYFTLREIVARVSEKATWVGAQGNYIVAFFKDGDDNHYAGFTLADFKDLAVNAQTLNNAVTA